MDTTLIVENDHDHNAALVQRVESLVAEFPQFAQIFGDLFGSPIEAFRLDTVTVPTDGAVHIRVRLEPTDRLRELMATFGAGEVY